jgi:hypothetical protein
MSSTKNIAIIIDGENIKPSAIYKVINKGKELGNIIVKRVYGDFSNPIMKSWKEPCLQHSIDCRQLWIDKSKNSTDMFIVTDCCFDIEKNHNIDIYIIVSGDGDFSILVSSLKKIGKTVYGMSTNRSSTNKRLLNVCDRFFYMMNENKKKEIIIKKKKDNNIQYDEIMAFVTKYLETEDANIKLLAQLKEIVLRKWCDFSEKDYGYLSFTKFLDSNEKLKIIINGSSHYVKLLDN